ncbi:putative gibberellin regulated protein [Helianthus annuus]|nr:putative gibberellin regulated protein [Helianthus annuus]
MLPHPLLPQSQVTKFIHILFIIFKPHTIIIYIDFTGSLGCDDKCEKRCAKSGYKERCLKYCGICCEKCQGCVPSTPYADKAECPCYRDLKNPKGKDKCP